LSPCHGTCATPFVDQSTALAPCSPQFAERSVPLFGRPAVQAPMRILMGAHMPAVLIELAFLSNADDEKAMASGDWQSAVIESVLAAIAEVRRGIPSSTEGR
jgi:N-acetylmuramoyl-L-alanine amidase